MTELQTSEVLKKALEAAKTRPVSQGEIVAQKISFVVSSFERSSSVTRERVKSELDKFGGCEAAE